MKESRIGVIGLGYVGLPLARLFSTKYNTIGFDINSNRIEELKKGNDISKEIPSDILKEALENGLHFTSDVKELKNCNIYVIAVPTPVHKNKTPDLTFLYEASKLVGQVIAPGDVVIYESTVYPGATEEDCIPVIEKVSGLKYNKDFFAGYSPERINPGDKIRTVEKIVKVTSGSTPEVAKLVDDLYASVITAGTHSVSSIKSAEACKIIENTQRDVNIALVNELSKIFTFMGVDTMEVLEAAGTKWNFLPFKPGLVGGHCIGVDPYYLAQKAQEYGYHPEIILAGRRLNDGMASYVASEVVKCMIRKDLPVKNADVLILGFTFKEDCADIRNTQVYNLYNSLREYGLQVDVYDPVASAEDAEKEYEVKLTLELNKKYDVVILAVAHSQFQSLDVKALLRDNGLIYDIKSVLPKEMVDGRL